jgi:hypothetical protein
LSGCDRKAAVAGATAGVADGVVVEARGEVLPERVQGGEDPVVHRGASGARVSSSNTNLTGGPPMLKSRCGPGLSLA